MGRWTAPPQSFIWPDTRHTFDGQARLKWKLRKASPWALSSLVQLLILALRSHLFVGGKLGTPKLSSWYVVQLVKEMVHLWTEFQRQQVGTFSFVFCLSLFKKSGFRKVVDPLEYNCKYAAFLLHCGSCDIQLLDFIFIQVIDPDSGLQAASTPLKLT